MYKIIPNYAIFFYEKPIFFNQSALSSLFL